MRWALSSALALWLVGSGAAQSASAPTAKTANGTYQGLYLPDWEQDAFLGIPYAQPPLGQLRFRWPQSINTSFDGARDATHYGYTCMQLSTKFNMSEDCLNLNVIRPSGDHQKLPVLVWIYGGGLTSGSTADPQYNLSGIVKVSQDMGQPIIAVDMNYRLGMWGFLQSPQILVEGSSNAGLVDQRMALQWIQENIEAFGGDPSRVVIWGESAGAQSIAYQLFSYDGRDDGLYRGAIMESGGPTGTPVPGMAYYLAPFENLTRAAGCWTAKDQLACLRGLSREDFFAALPTQLWDPLIDGTFLTGYPSQLIQENKFNRVALLIGTNSDEGFAVKAVSGNVNTDTDLFYGLLWGWRGYQFSPRTARKLLDLYPDDPCNEPPFDLGNCSVYPSRGLQWRRAWMIGADLVMHSGRRKMCELYTAAGQSVFSYRFDTLLNNNNALHGVAHFDNVAFSFQNITGLLGPSPQYDAARALARSIGEAYVNFVYSLDPNGSGKPGAKCIRRDNSTEAIPNWPKYDLGKPTNMVLNATSGPFVEDDTYRKEGIAYINSYEVARELYA